MLACIYCCLTALLSLTIQQKSILLRTQALAIIRRKPEGVSGEEYTRRLSLQLSQLQTDWRTKAVRLERELLRTRQELVNCQVARELGGQKESCEIYSQVH